MPIPMELITMGASFVASAVTTLFSQSMKKRQAIFEMAMAKGEKQAEIYQQVREAGTPGFQITRRVIALGVIGAFIWATMIMPVFFPHTPITVGLSETHGGFWFFTDPKEVFTWYTSQGGVVLTPLVTHMGSAITGFFFGNQISK